MASLSVMACFTAAVSSCHCLTSACLPLTNSCVDRSRLSSSRKAERPCSSHSSSPSPEKNFSSI
eukprot:1048651-Pyramimonas_sp.AAC.1